MCGLSAGETVPGGGAGFTAVVHRSARGREASYSSSMNVTLRDNLFHDRLPAAPADSGAARGPANPKARCCTERNEHDGMINEGCRAMERRRNVARLVQIVKLEFIARQFLLDFVAVNLHYRRRLSQCTAPLFRITRNSHREKGSAMMVAHTLCWRNNL